MLQRAQSQRGTYGSCNRHSARGRLEELNIVLPQLKSDFHKCLLLVVVMTALWPLGILLFCVVGPLSYWIPKGQAIRRHLKKFFKALCMWISVMIVVWLVPLICICYMWLTTSSLQEFVRRIEQISLFDMIELATCPGFIMGIICWAWVAEEAHTEVATVKTRLLMHWEDESAYGCWKPLYLSQGQRFAMAEAGVPALQENSSAPFRVTHLLLDVVHEMPGFEAGYQYEHSDRTLLQKLRDHEVHEQKYGLRLLDSFFLYEIFDSVPSDFHDISLEPALLDKLRYIHVVISHMIYTTPFTCSMLVGAAVLRAIIPRFWPWYMYSRPLFHTDLVLNIFSIYVDIIFGLMLAFAYLMGQAANILYKQNVMQMKVLTALIDVGIRSKYAVELASTFKRPDAVNMLGKLPLLDCRHKENVTAWWLVREFVLVDQHNEMLMVELVIEIASFGELIMIIVGLWYMIIANASTQTVLLCVTLDLFTVSWIVVSLILSSFSINKLLDLQIKAVLLIRHSVMSMFEIRPHQEDTEKIEEEKDDLCQIISHLVDKMETGFRQKPIFGMEATPIGVIAFGFTLVMTIFGLMEQLISLGVMSNTFQSIVSAPNTGTSKFMYR